MKYMQSIESDFHVYKKWVINCNIFQSSNSTWSRTTKGSERRSDYKPESADLQTTNLVDKHTNNCCVGYSVYSSTFSEDENQQIPCNCISIY